MTNLEFTLGLIENRNPAGKKINDFFLPMSLRVEDSSVEKSGDGEIVDFFFQRMQAIQYMIQLCLKTKEKQFRIV